MAGDYTLHIRISFEDVEILMAAGYNLCFTRDVSLDGAVVKGNVVFSAILSKYLAPFVKFIWQDLYQIYGMAKTKEGDWDAVVQTATASIEAGQEAILNPNGSVGIFGSSAAGQPFKVNNQWKNAARITVEMYDFTDEVYSPTYITTQVPSPSTTELLPAQTYLVFFDKTLVTGKEIGSKTSTPPFAFGFRTGQSEITLSYTGGEWRLEP